MKVTSSKVHLFDFLDYRQFLKEWYWAAKETRASYSFRTFSKKAGFTSPNFFKLVMDGDRNLTEESLAKFMVGLALNKQEQEFFRNLVFFNQAKNHEEKDRYYHRLLQSRKFNQLKPVEKSQYEFYSTWYHSVIRELATHPEFDGTPEWLSRRIFPAVTAQQAKKSLELLQTLGMIEPLEKGRFKSVNPLISTGAESDSLVLLNYHRNLLALAQDVVGKTQPGDRDVSAMTLGVAKERIPELKKKIQEFRSEILRMVSTDTTPEKVVFLAIQMIPATKEEGLE